MKGSPEEGGTHGIVGQDIIRHFKPDAVLLNFARGELVDSHAMKEFLEPPPPSKRRWFWAIIVIAFLILVVSRWCHFGRGPTSKKDGSGQSNSVSSSSSCTLLQMETRG
jgi:hypothetical protein